MRRAGRLKSVLIATLILMIPCVISGGPQPFPDTRAYLILGERIEGLFHIIPSAAAQPASDAPNNAVASNAQVKRDIRLSYTVAAARSPYYSLYLALLATIGTAWLVVFAQAFGTAVLLRKSLRVFDLDHHYLRIVAGLAFATAMPIFTFLLMPDFLGALSLLAAMVLLNRWNRLERGERRLFAVTVLATALFHAATMLVLLALGVGAWLATLVPRLNGPGRRTGAATIAACAAVGAVGLFAYPILARAALHERIYSPPFIAARLIADGPGRQYLHEHCGRDTSSSWCRFRNQPLADNNLILWSTNPRVGAFQLAGYDERIRLIQEQPDFVLKVFGAYPLDVLRTSIANAASLFVNYRVGEVLEGNSGMWSDPRFAVVSAIIPFSGRCMGNPGACLPLLRSWWVNPLLAVSLLISLATLAVLLGRHAALRATWGGAIVVCLAGLALNAIICGVLSGDAERYQSRMLPLIPLLAMCAVADGRRRRADASDPVPVGVASARA